MHSKIERHTPKSVILIGKMISYSLVHSCLCHPTLLIYRCSRYDEHKSDNSRGTASAASILYEPSGI